LIPIYLISQSATVASRYIEELIETHKARKEKTLVRLFALILIIGQLVANLVAPQLAKIFFGDEEKCC
jgi:hypothetical protein